MTALIDANTNSVVFSAIAAGFQSDRPRWHTLKGGNAVIHAVEALSATATGYMIGTTFILGAADRRLGIGTLMEC